MKDLFRDSMAVAGVRGAFLYDTAGNLLYSEFTSPPSVDPEQDIGWVVFVRSLAGVSEVELLFDSGRLYARNTVLGPLIIMMDSVPTGMVKLTAAILADRLETIAVQSMGKGSSIKSR